MSMVKMIEAVIMHCNIVDNNYQQNSRVFYTFVPNKSFGHFSDILHNISIFLKTFNSRENWNLIRKKIADKITRVPKNSPKNNSETNK